MGYIDGIHVTIYSIHGSYGLSPYLFCFFSGCVLNTLQDAAPVLAPVPQPDHDHRMGWAIGFYLKPGMFGQANISWLNHKFHCKKSLFLKISMGVECQLNFGRLPRRLLKSRSLPVPCPRNDVRSTSRHLCVSKW